MAKKTMAKKTMATKIDKQQEQQEQLERYEQLRRRSAQLERQRRFWKVLTLAIMAFTVITLIENLL